MSDLDRVVAGLRCRDVLDLLGDYVDGDLAPNIEMQINQHLRGCDTCERFGGEYASLVADLRRSLSMLSPDPGIRERLAQRMARAWSEEDV